MSETTFRELHDGARRNGWASYALFWALLVVLLPPCFLVGTYGAAWDGANDLYDVWCGREPGEVCGDGC